MQTYSYYDKYKYGFYAIVSEVIDHVGVTYAMAKRKPLLTLSEFEIKNDDMSDARALQGALHEEKTKKDYQHFAAAKKKTNL